MLRKQAHHLSSQQTSGNETRGHLQHHDLQQHSKLADNFDSECANIYGGPSYPGSAGDRFGPLPSFAIQSVAFGGRCHPSQDEARHLLHYDFQQRPQTHGQFDSECTNNDRGPIYPGSAGDRLEPPNQNCF